jgi:hypothetical protein
MDRRSPFTISLVGALLSIALPATAGCSGDNPTMVVVDNDFPAAAEGGGAASGVTVFKVWWVTSLMPDPVLPGAEGQPERTIPASDYAYAVLAPGWDPASGAPPTSVLAAKSTGVLTVAQGDTLHVHVSDVTFAGDCAAGQPLSQEDADLVTERIFPGEFAGVAYDAATCTRTPASEAGLGAQDDAGDGP